MLKLLVILVLGMYLTLQLGGEDRGQLRPGLAGNTTPKAAPVEIAPKVETSVLASSGTATMQVAPARPVVVAAVQPAVVAQPQTAEIVAVAFTPDAATSTATVAPARSVFTLSALPGQENAPAETALVPEVTTAPDIWYVTGRSVNVRMGPSTDDPVVGKLVRGDAALMLDDNGAGWAEITIEGDGITGFVKLDFLSPTAP